MGGKGGDGGSSALMQMASMKYGNDYTPQNRTPQQLPAGTPNEASQRGGTDTSTGQGFSGGGWKGGYDASPSYNVGEIAKEAGKGALYGSAGGALGSALTATGFGWSEKARQAGQQAYAAGVPTIQRGRKTKNTSLLGDSDDNDNDGGFGGLGGPGSSGTGGDPGGGGFGVGY